MGIPDKIIKSNRIITPSGVVNGYIIIGKGIILDVPIMIPDEWNHLVENRENNVVMAGIIDPHVHINEPGRTDWEGFDTATKAALAGGITGLVDMPLNASPVTTNSAAFDEKILSTNHKLHTHVGFWGGLIPKNTEDIELLIADGVLGFKAFLTHSGIDEFPNVTEEDLHLAMPIIAKYKLPLLVHCELSDELIHSSLKEHPTSYKEYLASRPKQWEDDAVAMMIRLCEQYNCHTHIVHLSSANAIAQIKAARDKGLPITVETAQHYLYFNAEDIADGQTAFKCAPPIREKANNELLWKALEDGIIDFVATDHSPAPPDIKELETGNFLKAWGGISSIQFALPVLWTAAIKHNIDIVYIAKWLSEHPSMLMGLQNRKGKIVAGYDADLVIWDPEDTFRVTEDIIQHKHKTTPYLGQKLKGVVKETWLLGQKVYDNGAFLLLNQGKILVP